MIGLIREGAALRGLGIGLFLLPRFSFLGFGATAAMGFVGSVATIAGTGILSWPVNWWPGDARCNTFAPRDSR